MVDFNRKRGNLFDRSLRENDEGYDDLNLPPIMNPIVDKDYSKTYKGRPEVVKIEGIIIRETDSAILFKFQPPECNISTEWFPLSQIQSIRRHPGEKSEVVMSKWIAIKKNIVT